MTAARRVGLVIAIAAAACGGGVADGTLRLLVGDQTKLRVSPDGAIVLDKDRVASVGEDGKVVDRNGRAWAWLYPESIRLAGGAQIPIKTSDDGSLYLPITAQEEAGLKPVRTRVAKSGDVLNEDGGRTRMRIAGIEDEKSRRIGLLLLLLLANPPSA